jgi:chloramphenicol 3-O phosphotransferase
VSEPGRVVILNGAPRSGKSSIATAMVELLGPSWHNIGVDSTMAALPETLLPGLGLRPGGERPDLEPHIPGMYRQLFATASTGAAQAQSYAIDVGVHDSYTRPLAIWPVIAQELAYTTTLVVGVRCPLNSIMERRGADTTGTYAVAGDDGAVPEPVHRWQHEVHRPGAYDLEVDSSVLTPADAAAQIAHRLATGEPGTALATHLPAS